MTISGLFQEAVAAYQMGRLADAEQACLQVIAQDPRHADALHLLGVLCYRRGNLLDAESWIKQALQVHETATMLGHMGNLLSDMDRMHEAQQHYLRALVLDPAHSHSYFNYANLLQKQRREHEAERALLRSLEITPEFAEANLQLGVIWQERRHYAGAEFCYRRALVTRPDFIEALVNLAEALKLMLRHVEAELHLKTALVMAPSFAKALNNLAVLYSETERRDEAKTLYLRVLAVEPNHENVHLNLAHLHQELQQYSQAQYYFGYALAMDAPNPQVQFNYGSFLLLQGEYLRGWQRYEARWKTVEAEVMPKFAQPRWLGNDDISGKTILLHAEQGLGDTLQFVRYANLLHAQGARVLLLVPSLLKTLLASCAGVAGVFTAADDLPAFDYHSPLMSLPLLCGTTLGTIPATTPYLFAQQDAIELWRQKLGAGSAIRVGLVWAGAARRGQAAAYIVDRQRSMHFQQIRPLLDVDGVEFHSLQVDAEARAQIGGDCITDHGADLRDFADTAALVANLDLVICVDTSIAHLTRAIGKPFWLLNRYNTCWRWLTERSDSPWYPSARLFRQPRPGDWASVVRDVKSALEDLTSARS